MRIVPRSFISFSLVFAAASLLPVSAAELWVSTDGSDRAAGTKERPFATVAFAQRQARELRRLGDPSVESGVRIIVREGIYPLTTSLFFRPEDSGTETSPTIIEAATGEHPVLSGGVRLAGWKKLKEDVPGIPKIVKGKLWVADTPRFGGRILETRQLWIGERKANRARYNNNGLDRLMDWDRDRCEAVIPTAVLTKGNIKGPAGLELFLTQQWEIAVLRVKALRSEGSKTYVTFHEQESKLEFEHPWPQPLLTSTGAVQPEVPNSQPTVPSEGYAGFNLIGAIGFLDEPGEWWQEPGSGRVFYWPRADEDLLHIPAMVPALASLLEISGTPDRPVAHVQFKGIGFSHTSWTRPAESGHVPLQAGMYLIDAYKLRPPGVGERAGLENQAWIGRMPAGVTVTGAHHVRFERSRFEQMAGSALDFVSGTHDDTIEGCLFRDIGGNGIQLGSFQTGGIETHLPYNPSDEREICTRERIANNLVTDCANEDWGCVGIGVGYAREVNIEHNEVVNVSYTGISVGWGWTKAPNAMRDNRIHANLLRGVATRMCDTAGIYTLSAQPGTVISENSVEEITMSAWVDRPEHWFYLYTDEGSSCITVRDNWCPAEKFLQNANGPGNVWERNGPDVPAAIKNSAGLEPAFRNLRLGERVSSQLLR